MPRRLILYPLIWCAVAPFGGCAGVQSMLNPQSPGAETVADVWWVMFWGSVLILALVMALALYAIYRKSDRPSPVNADWMIGGGGVALPTVTLTALLLYGFYAGDVLQGQGASDPPLTIDVTGHRWWWEVRYPDDNRGTPGITANEIHIPVGRPVRVRLRTADVIHSFWVPQLSGKQDLIPGHVNELTLRADRAGRFRGQCAEFCGEQHAHMAFWVVAEPEEAFEAWRARQREPARAPLADAERQGREHFLSLRCIECHTIRGTPAEGRVGPDLTHVGGRATIAAATLPRSRESIGRWIVDNQRIKPGNRMPEFGHLQARVVDELAAYLDSLR